MRALLMKLDLNSNIILLSAD